MNQTIFCKAATTSRRPDNSADRRGSILILAAIMMVALVGLCVFAIDVGYMMVARTQLQQSADAAALAGCAELIDNEAITGTVSMTDEVASARSLAIQYAALNKVCKAAPTVNSNAANTPAGDIVVGTLSYPFPANQAMDFSQPNGYNAVQVTVNRTAASNGEVNLFFARLFGFGSRPMTANATAALVTNFGGFRVPRNGDNLGILPIALDLETWTALLAGSVTTDNFTWDADGKRVQAGSDGVREVNLYPQGTGSPGNRGTVDIGGSENSTNDIARQITDGVSAADMAHFPNSELKFDANGELFLNGETGISDGVKDELASIIGKPRIIPVFKDVAEPGNTATYTIVAYAGIRIVEVHLTGPQNKKRVMIQPAMINANGGIPSSGPQSSYYTYSKPWLIR